jgi:hypothetical protein
LNRREDGVEQMNKGRSKAKRIDHNGSPASRKELIKGNWMSFAWMDRRN